MRRIKEVCAAAVLVFLISCGEKKEVNQTETATPKSKAEQVVTGKDLGDNTSITYSLSGALNGKMTINRNGKDLKQIVDSEVMGIQSKNITYIKENTVYSITEVAGKKLGIKTDLSKYNSMKQTGETIADPDEFRKFLEGKSVKGTEDILGYKCNIYDMGNNVSLSVADGKYLLRIKAPDFLAIATAIQPLDADNTSEFAVPADIEFKSVTPDNDLKDALESKKELLKK